MFTSRTYLTFQYILQTGCVFNKVNSDGLFSKGYLCTVTNIWAVTPWGLVKTSKLYLRRVDFLCVMVLTGPPWAGGMGKQVLGTHSALTASWNASSSQSRSLCVNSLTSCYKRGINGQELGPTLYSGKWKAAHIPPMTKILSLWNNSFLRPNIMKIWEHWTPATTNNKEGPWGDLTKSWPGGNYSTTSSPHLSVTNKIFQVGLKKDPSNRL